MVLQGMAAIFSNAAAVPRVTATASLSGCGKATDFNATEQARISTALSTCS